MHIVTAWLLRRCSTVGPIWPREVEGTSLAMAYSTAVGQAVAQMLPVQAEAPEPMFRASPVLRHYDAGGNSVKVWGITPS